MSKAKAVKAIAQALKDARKSRNLSQRELSSLANVPQGHISKIENSAVDLRLSSLSELAHALELELLLVPQQHVKSVQTMVKSPPKAAAKTESAEQTYLEQLQERLRQIIRDGPSVDAMIELTQIRRILAELEKLPISSSALRAVRSAGEAAQKYQENEDALPAVREALARLNVLHKILPDA